MSHQRDQLLTCCSFADKAIEGTYLLINGQVQALCKQHEPVHFTVQGENKTTGAVGDSMERYPERCFHIIAPGQPKFDFNTSSISPLYETSYKTFIFNYKQIKIMSMPQ